MQSGRAVSRRSLPLTSPDWPTTTASSGPRDLFFCVRGFTRDGHEFAADAVTEGRRRWSWTTSSTWTSRRWWLRTSVARWRRPPRGSTGDPTATLELLGVTGTNGKTTTAYLVRALLEAAGRQTGLLGTVKSVIGGIESELQRTTPEAIDLQRSFRAMLEGGDVACVMEVSSHALELARADASHFAAGVFTNLTQDHLDFHPTMEDYFQAKRACSRDLAARHAIINLDDPYGARLATDARIPEPITFALDDPSATYRADDLRTDLTGSQLHAALSRRSLRAERLRCRGRFNVYNVLGALAAARAVGVPFDTAVTAIERAGQVPGRFEAVDEGQPFAVLVDYAHTPDSLENVLAAARNLTATRLHVVFGCRWRP